jgi:flagellar hook assembly protein FlgD
LPAEKKLTCPVHTLTGQKVATLAEGLRQAGTYTLRWDGKDDEGREVASGVYLYRLVAGERMKTRKLLLLK